MAKSPARPAREVVEKAFSLVRSAPVSAWGAYYLGSMPFCGALVYFLSVMDAHARAEARLPDLALLLTVLFVWMKAWQARFAAELTGMLRGEPPGPWGWRTWLAVAARQSVLQGAGLLLLPFAVMSVIGFVPVYAFCQGATALDEGRAHGWRALARAANKEAQRWPAQATVVTWMLSPMLLVAAFAWYRLGPGVGEIFGFLAGGLWMFWGIIQLLFLVTVCPIGTVVALNLAGAAVFGAMLLKSYLDVSTIYVWAPGAAMHPGFTAAIVACTYLAMDPVLKAAFVLRCFQGAALHTGEDLRASLRRVGAAALSKAAPLILAALGGLLSGAASAEEAGAMPAALDSALEAELAEPIYAWRLPQAEDNPGDAGWLVSRIREVSAWAERNWRALQDWFRDFFKRSRDDGSAADGDFQLVSPELLAWITRVLAAVIVALLLVAVAVVARRQWLAYRREAAQAEAAALELPVSVEDESARADALPEEGWLRLASEYFAQGDHRLAMRALFLATLSVLAERKLITIGRYKPNSAYINEMRRRVPVELAGTFQGGVRLYEETWYGDHAATPEGFAALRAAHDRVCGR